jgi:redox-sensitive bicupin YhaK (pirin superfamily)
MSTLQTIVRKARGSSHGPITRLISPQDALGEMLKPFVFLDFFDAHIEPGFGFGMHPHSGIATLTWQPDTDVQYEDTTGQAGVLKAGGLEWMNAGGGAWHQGHLLGSGRTTGFQLWVAMPPEVENGPSFGQYVPPSEVALFEVPNGQVKVLLGSVTAPTGALVHSPINTHQDMNYLIVELAAGASWHYTPPATHDVAWAFVFDGQALVQGERSHKELLVLSGQGEVSLQAEQEPSRIVLGSAKRHPHALVLGPSSVHTSTAALQQGRDTIQEIGARLQVR